MMQSLSPLQRRVLALALLALTILIVWFIAVQPIVAAIVSSSDERQATLRRLSRDSTLVAQDAEVRAALSAVEQNPRWARFYDSQKTDRAVLQLETDLRALVTTPNNPTSMIVQPATAQGRVTRLAVKVTLSMSIDQLAETLSRMQLNSRLLKIESLTIQAPDYQVVDTNPTLSIQAEIVGYMLTKPRSQT
jgi:hypothetical protein